MNFILEGEQIDHVDFSGASIYLDACFVLNFYSQEGQTDLSTKIIKVA